jgi:hypothetical protein
MVNDNLTLLEILSFAGPLLIIPALVRLRPTGRPPLNGAPHGA